MAVAFDASGFGNIATSAGESWSHTVAGGGTILFVATYKGNGAATLSVTYNGVAMTSMGSRADGGSTCELWCLMSPATGSHTVQLTISSGTLPNGGCSTSYTGTGTTISTNKTTNYNANPVGGLATSLTITANDWMIIGAIANHNPTVAGTGATYRIGASTDSVAIFDTNGAPGSGSKSMTVDDSGTSYIEVVMVAFGTSSVYTLTIGQGSITYTGQSIILNYGKVLTMSVGTYTLTGQTLSFVGSLWTRITKNSSSNTNATKHSSNWTNTNKDNSTFTNNNKSS